MEQFFASHDINFVVWRWTRKTTHLLTASRLKDYDIVNEFIKHKGVKADIYF
jgi:hypothetical protein